MKRFFTFAILLLAPLAAIHSADSPKAASRPNIIVIVADDLGWGDPSCYPKGGAWGPEALVATPNIDALAASGARCTDGYATCMVCSPSRVGLLSGRYQQRLGFYGFVETNVGIPKNVRLLPEVLRAAGYQTGMVGKWHVGFPRGQRPLDRGFDHFFGFIGGQHDYFDAHLGQPTNAIANAPDAPILDQDEPLESIGYLSDDFTDRALSFLQTATQAKKPFFLYLPYSAPHPPMQAPWKDLEPFAKLRTNDRFNERDIARAMIVNLDANIGRVLHWMRESGMEKDTLVFFTSDNGGADDGPGHVTQHNGGLRGRKGYFYEGGIRIPYLVSWPGHIPAATVYRQPVSHLDIYATVLAAAGGTTPDAAPLDGVNLLPFLSGERDGAPHERLFWSMEKTPTKWAVREADWKLVNEDTQPTISQRDAKATFQTQLYNLADDPFEQHDLASAQPDRVASLQRAMTEFHATMKPSIFTVEDAAKQKVELEERSKNPALREHPRADGSPGHWIGAGAKERMEKEVPRQTPPSALTTPRIESFPREGLGYKLIDWHQRAEDFLAFTLDPVRKGDYLPLMWWDDSKVHWKQTTFGLPSYVGMKHQWGMFRNAHEGVVTMGTLLSGALLGHDMTHYTVPGDGHPVDLVKMQEAYFSPDDGVFLDGIGAHSGGSFWYDLTPSLFAGALVAAYPHEESLTEKWHASSQRWAQATLHLWQLNDFNFQAYDLRKKRAIVEHWREPDSAAALAFLMQMAHAKWPEEQTFYYETRHALDWLCAQDRNINYEFFPAFGVYAAARCNAEDRTSYDVGKVFGWCFEDSAVRGIGPHQADVSKGDGYGIVNGRWGEHDVAGLVGCSRGALSTPKMRGGYVFPMETFAYAWPLVAATRYDNRLARAVGKWMHAAVHSARLIYPDQLPPEKQSDWAWASKYTSAIPYEGLMEKNNHSGEPGPFASGDPTNQGWGPSNLGIYSGALSGIFGAIVKPTNVEGVLAIDTNKTDYFAKPSFPTTLLYNPHTTTVKVKLPVGDKPVSVWDAVSNSWLAERATNDVEINIPPDAAVMATFIPADEKPRFEHGQMIVGNIIADYSATKP